ncbi:MAG: HD-GYP domain-containing protein [Nitrospirae bacterium]|nr:HD-GYP domain-containing protein [Nitrospirota bacterium]
MATRFREIDEPDVPVPVNQLSIGSRIPCDMFIKDGLGLKVFFNKDTLFTNASRDILRDKGISEVYIYQRDEPHLDFYISKTRLPKQSQDRETPASFKQYAFTKEQHYQIDPSMLIEGTTINFSLSVLDDFNFSSLVEASDKYPVVVDSGILNVAGDVVIKKTDLPRYHEYISYLRKSYKFIDNNESKTRALAIRETSKIVLQSFLEEPRSGEKIKEVEVLVNDIIGCILADQDSIYTLLSMKGYDYYTYTHSVNVSAMAVSLGITTGLTRVDIEKLGMGAMLHDIGKSQISHEILDKQGRLSDVEYTIIKNHVIEGEKIMRDHKSFPEESIGAVIHHHEKLTGKGYPFGLAGKDISFFGRITAISDCYDALTTRRPYKAPFTPFYALMMISKDTGDYDPDLLKIFIRMLGKIK